LRSQELAAVAVNSIQHSANHYSAKSARGK
jgi:hypothetical protein